MTMLLMTTYVSVGLSEKNAPVKIAGIKNSIPNQVEVRP